ncbi:MAG TPA: AmpG family muropeptide MFS transporter, partial [Ottowia sp.]|nr:AmpG family muropeptide MFS transporter [Ottowia sp.]
MADAAARPHGWLDSLRIYLQPASLRMLALGFSAGLPLLLVLGTLSFRLREAGVDRGTIGHLSWVGLAYGFKWVWAPLVDRLPLPGLTRWLGRRRSWLLLAQLGVAAGLVGMALADPRVSLTAVVWCALAVAFASATQDIALDAYRIESAPTQQQPALAATYQTGYRLAMIWAGAGVLWLAARAQGQAAGYDHAAWQLAYVVMAASMAVGVLTVLLSPEPAPRPLARARSAGEWVRSALVEPFADFFRRYQWQAALILALIAIYRISDVVMGIMANP